MIDIAKSTGARPFIRSNDVLFVAFFSFAAIGFLLFTTVGHLADIYFQAFSILGFLVAFAAVRFQPRRRYFFFAFVAVSAPRILSIFLGRPSHNILFPLFCGMAASLYLQYPSGRRGNAPSPGEGSPGISILIVAPLFVFFLFMALRSFVDYYSPYVLTGYPLLDLQAGIGVSANYSIYLSLLLFLNLTGPLLFIMADGLFRSAGGGNLPTRNIANGIFAGLSLGMLFSLGAILLQMIGWNRLYAGSALSLQEHRPPGLFTDSGASAFLLPVLLFGCCYYLFFKNRKISARLTGLLRSRKLKTIFLHAFLPVLLFGIGLTQGRAFWLSTIGLYAVLIMFRLMRRKKKIPGRQGVIVVLALVGAFALFVLLLRLELIPVFFTAGKNPPDFFVRRVFALDFAGAYHALDAPRHNLFLGGITLFREHPLLGTGLNSLMVEIPALRRQIPSLPMDNPASLYIGILSDTGIIGTLIFFLAAAHCLLVVRNSARFLGYSVTILTLFPFFMALPFLIGYHIISAETAPLLFLPFFFGRITDFRKTSAGRSFVLLNFIILVLTALYMILYIISIDLHSPIAYWRFQHTGSPQLIAQAVERDKVLGEIYWFGRRRDLALRAGPSITLVLLIDGAGPYRLIGRCSARTVEKAGIVSPGRKTFVRLNIPSDCTRGSRPHILLELPGAGKNRFGIGKSQISGNRIVGSLSL